jgi:putative pyruvate formate lyase activating enzyme
MESIPTSGQGPQLDERFIIEPFEPAYRNLPADEIEARVAAGLRELADCCACPRNCHVNRLANDTKICNTGRYARVASAFPHLGEEDCLRGCNGSGTIFFSLCNLRCVFCQNWDISQRAVGDEVPADGIATLMLTLQNRGCHNINFVTPEHVAPQVLEAVAAAIPQGLKLPIVYKTSAYDSVESLKLFDGIIDIYMPDFKFWKRETAKELAKAPDYPARARDAIAEMHRQVGPLKFGRNGLARRGVLVRHLVMPGQLDQSTAIFRWLADLSPDTYVNIMGQYHPEYEVGQIASGGGRKYPEINCRTNAGALTAAYEAARTAGLWRFDERSLRT